MTAPIRPVRVVRRVAVLDYPQTTLNDATFDALVEDGFNHVGIIYAPSVMPGQGFSFDQLRRLAELTSARGLGLIAASGFMKYENELLDREPERAMVLRGPGTARDSDGLPSRWLCPFQRANLERYHDVLASFLALPPLVELHLNDEAFLGFPDGKIGCYCPSCVRDYRDETGEDPPAEHDFDSDAWWRWIEYRMRRWTEVHAGLRDWVKARRPEVRVGLQHSPAAPARAWQPWKSGIDLAMDAKALDVLATDPYPFNHASLIDHRPHRRILSETVRSLQGACHGRATTIYPQGFMPPGMAPPMGRDDGLHAAVVPLALGADTIGPFNYPLMKIIPGFAEAFAETRKLDTIFESHQPYRYATVVSPLQSEMRGHPAEDWGRHYVSRWADVMCHTGYAWGWCWDGRLEDAADHLAGPLVLPDTHALSRGQCDAVRRYGERHGLLWIGERPSGEWSGRGACPRRRPQERGRFLAECDGSHGLLRSPAEPPGPLVFQTHSPVELESDWQVLGRIGGDPAIAVRTRGGMREAFFSGMPATHDVPPGQIAVAPSGGVELLRRVLRWLAGSQPLVWIDPAPPVDAYRKLRPGDYRNAPVAEVLPMTGDGGVLALVVIHTPVPFDLRLHMRADYADRLTRVVDRWTGRDLTQRITRDQDGHAVIALEVPGDAGLVAIACELAASQRKGTACSSISV